MAGQLSAQVISGSSMMSASNLVCSALNSDRQSGPGRTSHLCQFRSLRRPEQVLYPLQQPPLGAIRSVFSRAATTRSA